MKSRNMFLLSVAASLSLLGVVAMFAWDARFGITAILVLNLLLIVLALLERRKMAQTQQRLLKIIESNASIRRELLRLERVSQTDIQKLAGLVQAQQISLEIATTTLESRDRPTDALPK